MALPRDRLLLMVIAITGLIVVIAGWAGGLLQAEAEGWTGWAARIGLVVALILVLAIVWLGFTQIDRKES